MVVPVIPRYERFRKIGSGGFSEVYEAWQPDFNRRVAVKVLTLGQGLEIDRDAFDRECRAIGTVSDHPNIVDVYDSGLTDGGLPYITMALYHETLQDRVRASGALSAAEVLDCGVQICAALQRAHDERMLHRDIKPQNIFFSNYGMPALGDFGIASLGDDEGEQVGLTFHYAAPEVLDGGEPTVESDIYSLGATLYTALAGHRPFRVEGRNSHAELTNRILSQPPPPITGQPLPPGVERTVIGLLAKHPNDRPRSALELGELLRDLQSRSGYEPTPIWTAVVEVDDVTLPRRPGNNVTATPIQPAPRDVVDPSPQAAPPAPIAAPGDDLEEDGTAVTRYRPKKTDRPTEDYQEKEPSRRGRVGAIAVAAVLAAAGIGYMVARGGSEVVAPTTTTTTASTSTTETEVVDNSAPDAPSGLQSSVDGDVVVVSWDPVDRADSYRVEWLVGDGSVRTVSEPTIELPAPEDGSPQCLVVRSVSAVGRVGTASEEFCL